jgi:serine/threonine protein kinase
MPAPGDTLFHGRFRLRAPIGRGGAGTVWEADDLRDGGLVAVTLLPADAGGLAAAEREAEVAVRVKHPSAVRVALTFEEHGHAAVVMERCVASAAEHVLARGPFAPERAAQIAVAVLDALEAAHAVGVVHRDVKPANVLLRADGSAALADWGIARALFGSGGTHTTSVALLGTLPYMAPELLRSVRGAAYTRACDVYSFGIALNEVLTQTVPYSDAMTEQVQLHTILEARCVRPTDGH